MNCCILQICSLSLIYFFFQGIQNVHTKYFFSKAFKMYILKKYSRAHRIFDLATPLIFKSLRKIVFYIMH